MFRIVLSSLIALPVHAAAQGYTNWFLGSTTDAQVQALGGVCLMGGATENDEAMRWFLQRASGGDVLVLRASGSSGYQNYFFSELGIPVNSVETIRFDNASAAQSPYVHERIQRAEAIWFAGGDQWNYVNYWRGTAIDSLINIALNERNIVIGGTSAGMAILGGVYFSAQNGTISTSAALMNPYAPNMTVDNTPFLQVPWLEDVVTDTHYDNPDRRGRHTAFMARARVDYGIDAKGIACNEYTAVCLAPDGIARVFGEWPQYPEFAFFVQVNCLYPQGPELCQPGSPLTWNHGGQAVKACKVAGTMQGSNTFDLNDWRSTSGGMWEDWRVQQGVFTTAPGDPAVDCSTGIHTALESGHLRFDRHHWNWVIGGLGEVRAVRTVDIIGRTVHVDWQRTADGLVVQATTMPAGVVLLTVEHAAGRHTWKLMKP